MDTIAIIMAMLCIGALSFLYLTVIGQEKTRQQELENDPEYQMQLAEKRTQYEREERDRRNGYTVLVNNGTMQIIQVIALHGYKQVEYLTNNGWVLTGSNIIGGDYYKEHKTCQSMIWTGKVAIPTTYSCDRNSYTPLMDRFIFVSQQNTTTTIIE